MKKVSNEIRSLDPTMTAYSLQCAFDICKLVHQAAKSAGAPKSFVDSLVIALREIHSCLIVCDVHVQ